MKKLALGLPIERRIYLLRGRRVILDSDLARVYGVATSRLNQQVNRNRARFPDDFLFRLTRDEFKSLMLQIGDVPRSPGGRGGVTSRLRRAEPPA